MAKKGWSNYNGFQSKRHSNARRLGKAGGMYAKPKKRFSSPLIIEKVPYTSTGTPEKDVDYKIKGDIDNSPAGTKEEWKDFAKEKNVKLKVSDKPLSERQISNAKYEKYIIDSIDAESYGKEPKNNKEKLQFLRDTFRDEYYDGNPNAQSMGERRAFEEWIRGLPSSFNIDFYNTDILKLAKKNGTLRADASEKEEERVLENYWNYITNKTFIAFNKYDVN